MEEEGATYDQLRLMWANSQCQWQLWLFLILYLTSDALVQGVCDGSKLGSLVDEVVDL
jgi:hypothetical protein